MHVKTESAANRVMGALLLYVFLFSMSPMQGRLFAEAYANPAAAVRSAPTLATPAPKTGEPVAVPVAAKGQAAAAVTAAAAETAMGPQVLAQVRGVISAEKGGTLTLEGVKLEIPAGAVAADLEISLEQLATVPAMNAGLDNVTPAVAGFRALPHGTQFLKPVHFTMPYDARKVDTIGKKEGLASYFYNETDRKWTKLERIGIDEQAATITSMTTHFTDFITGTLKLPDTPKPLGFNPNSIKDIKAADPAAHVPKVDGLQGGQTGAASFQVALKVPEGRGGMQPQLALSYNSGGSSGWLGQGFDINVPSITIDTKNGIPDYSKDEFVYNWSGQELVRMGVETGGRTLFEPRVEGAYATIMRIRLGGNHFKWEVQEKNGMTTTFGEEAGSYKGNGTNDYVWMQSRVENANGNWMHWAYAEDQGHLYLDHIDYTLKSGDTAGSIGGAYYRVQFTNEATDRADRRIDMRGGYLNKLAKRLGSVSMSYWDKSKFVPIRGYQFTYRANPSTFGKSLLESYAETDAAGTVIYKYGFEYQGVAVEGGKVLGLTPKTANGNFAGDLQETFSTNYSIGGNISGGVGIKPLNVTIVDLTVGGNISVSGSDSYENTAIMDVNGDGINDIIQHNMKAIGAGQRILLGNGDGTFSQASYGNFPPALWNVINGKSSSQSSFNWGLFGTLNFLGLASVGISYSATDGNSTTQWTYMDMNGDGLVDIIATSMPTKYYKNVSSGNTVSFEIEDFQSASAPPAQSEIYTPSATTLKRSHLLDPLRMWLAPYEGRVSIQSTAKTVAGNAAQASSKWDGVTVEAYTAFNGLPAQKLNIGNNPLKANNPEIVLPFASSYDIKPMDHLILKQGSVQLTENDAISWVTKIKYSTVKLFAAMENKRFVVFPVVYETQSFIQSERDILSPYYNELVLTETDLHEPISSRWTLKDTAHQPDPASATALATYFKARGYYFYQKLTQEQFYNYKNRGNTGDDAADKPNWERWDARYLYDPLTDLMVLDAKYETDLAEKRAIFNAMFASPWKTVGAPAPAIPGFEPGQTAVNADSGKMVSSQVLDSALNNQAGSVGYQASGAKFSNNRILIEKTIHPDGGETMVYALPYYDLATAKFHTRIQAETNGLAGAWIDDTWIDGQVVLTTSLSADSANHKYYIDITGAWPASDQKKSFRFQYNPIKDFSAEEMLTLWRAKLLAPLPPARMQAVKDKMAGYVVAPKLADLTSLFTEDTQVQPHVFTMASGLSTANKALVLWYEFAIGALDGTKITYANYAVDNLNEAVIDKTDPLNPVAKTRAAFYADYGSLITTLNTSQYNAVKAFLNSIKAETADAKALTDRFESMYANAGDPLVDPFTIMALPPADELYAFWWAWYADTFSIPSVTQDFAANTAKLADGHESTPSVLYLADGNITYTYQAVRETISCDSDTVFTVQAAPVTTPTIQEYGVATPQPASGTHSAIKLAHFDSVSGCTVENYVYLHDYDTSRDTVADDYHSRLYQPDAAAPQKAIKVTSKNIFYNYAGGGFNWYYAEWDGYRAFDEALIATQNAAFDDTDGIKAKSQNTTQDSRKNLGDDLNGVQVIWRLSWDPIRVQLDANDAPVLDENGVAVTDGFGDFWHGSPIQRKESVWDAQQGKIIQTVFPREFGYIANDKTMSFRLGGDGPIKATPPVITPGGGISWIRGSSSTSETWALTLPIINIAVSKGSSQNQTDLMDVNGDRLPDLIQQDGSQFKVFKNTGKIDQDMNAVDAPAARTPVVSFEAAGSTLSNSPGSFRQFDNSSLTVSASLSPGASYAAVQDLKSSGKVGAQGTDTASAAGGFTPVSLSASIGIGSSYKKTDLVDLNGDGLPDYIKRDSTGIKVYLNNGSGFATTPVTFLATSLNADVNASIDTRFGALSGILNAVPEVRTALIGADPASLLSYSGSTNASASISAGYGSGGVSISGGIGVSASTDRTYFDFVDLNGDGLSDLAFKDGRGLKVCFNLGDSFMAPVAWGSEGGDFNADISGLSFTDTTGQPLQNDKLNLNQLNGHIDGGYSVKSPLELDEEIASSTNLGVNANLGVSATVNIPVWILTIHVGFGLNGSIGLSVNDITSGYNDINGDGLPDSVIKAGGATFVRYNQTGMDGLLSAIKTPTGGSIALEYARTGNSTQDPNQHIVLKSVTRSNWDKDTVRPAVLANNPMVTTFAYSGGYHNRYDRSFWGFRSVTETQLDTGVANTTTISTYDNTNYYRKNKLLTKEVYDRNNALQDRQEYRYSTGAVVANKSYAVLTTNEISSTYADSGEMKAETEYASYDAFGNPRLVKNYQNGKPKTTIEIGYAPLISRTNYFMAGLPNLIKVYDARTNQLMRKRTGTYDPITGNLKTQESYWTDTEFLRTSFDYDANGNITRSSDATGYYIDLTYDTAMMNQFVVGVKDAFGQTTSWNYNYLWGADNSQTDMDGNTMSKVYDSFGRLVSVQSPYDTGTARALTFSYDTSQFPWSATTHNKVSYDPADTKNVTTVIFSDGLGSVIQTKKSSMVLNAATGLAEAGWTVSPWVVTDNLGREKQKGIPTFESGLTNLGLYTAAIKPSFAMPDIFTQNSYDTRGRMVDQRIPDSSPAGEVHQKTAYKLASYNGEPAWSVTTTDPENHQKTQWQSLDELTLAVIQDAAAGGKNYQSKFSYDAIGQMLSASDAKGNLTTVNYDVLGRKTSIANPDTGLVTSEYDQYGDLTRKVDPVLRKANLFISYTYDKHRLLSTNYPDGSADTNVYGDGSQPNSLGRVVETRNGAVTTKSEYGKLGEVTRLTRAIKSSKAGVPDYAASFSYDYNYLGQMNSMTTDYAGVGFPRIGGMQETITYGYDDAGQVVSVAGTTPTGSYKYVNAITYDVYGQRTSIDFENGTKTRYYYDPARRWLNKLDTQIAATKESIQEFSYEFDKNGNILKTVDKSTGKSTTQEYKYDELDQLISAAGSYSNTSFSFANTTKYAQSYAYDSIGNMTRKLSSLSRTIAKADDAKLNYKLDYVYDPAKPHQATQIGDMHYQYDENGNITKIIPDSEFDTQAQAQYETIVTSTYQTNMDVADSALGRNRALLTTSAPGSTTRSLGWDYENRLVKVDDNRMSVSYAYDPSGERRLKSLKINGQITEEDAYLDRTFEIENASNSPIASVNIYLGETRIATKLVNLNNRSDITEWANTFVYHPDHLGSSSLITNSKGQEYERIAFTPHGEIWQQDSLDGFDSIDILFTGKSMDAETGWYYFGARYLDPKTGLWLSGDPALGEYIPRAPLTKEDKEANGKLPGMGGIYNPVNFALYHYAGNNPIKYTDPDGRELKIIGSDAYKATILGNLQSLTRDTLALKADGTLMITKVDNSNSSKLNGTELIRNMNMKGSTNSQDNQLVTIQQDNTVSIAGARANDQIGKSDSTKGSGTEVFLDPSQNFTGLLAGKVKPGSTSSSPTVLAHELIHAYHNKYGKNAPGSTGGVKNEELNTVGLQSGSKFTENKIRTEQSDGERLSY